LRFRAELAGERLEGQILGLQVLLDLQGQMENPSASL